MQVVQAIQRRFIRNPADRKVRVYEADEAVKDIPNGAKLLVGGGLTLWGGVWCVVASLGNMVAWVENAIRWE